MANISGRWPEAGHPGTPILHQGEFANGRGIFKLVGYRDPAETVDDDYPVWLTTGRRLASYHTRTQTGRAAGIDYLLSEEALEIHPDDVLTWGLEDGSWCTLSSRRGTVPSEGPEPPISHHEEPSLPVSASTMFPLTRSQARATIL